MQYLSGSGGLRRWGSASVGRLFWWSRGVLGGGEGRICGGWAHWVFGVCAGGLGVVFAGAVRCSVAVGGVCVCLCVCVSVCIYIGAFNFCFSAAFC